MATMSKITFEKESNISRLSRDYPAININDIRRIFGYLEKYCKLINNGEIPERVFTELHHEKCSAYQIKKSVENFIQKNFSDFTTMNPVDVVKFCFGENAFENAVLSNYLKSPEEKAEETAEESGKVEGTMEDVDGGSKKRKTKRVKKQTKRVKKSTKRVKKHTKRRHHLR
jgi:hypothetical protein